MNFELIKLWAFLLIAAIPGTNAVAQKVNVGYDKSADFSKYASYTWAEPERAPITTAALCKHCRLDRS